MCRIQTILHDAADSLALVSDSPLLDAEILLCKTISRTRSHLRAWPNKQLPPEQINAFLSLLAQRQQGTPIAYLTGNREFWSRDFIVSPDVLIPRPETELLVELSLNLIPNNQPSDIIDLGTGSGIIAITLAAERAQAQISATDVSVAALHIARRNAEKHGISHIQFFQSNWFSDIPEKKYNLVISNPPYIAKNDSHLQQGDVRFEPQTALRAEEQGLSDIRIIASDARNYLKSSGHLCIEHGYNQQQQVQTLFKQLLYSNIQTYKDLAGQPRVTCGQWNPN